MEDLIKNEMRADCVYRRECVCGVCHLSVNLLYAGLHAIVHFPELLGGRTQSGEQIELPFGIQHGLGDHGMSGVEWC